MAIENTNNIVYDFLTASRFRISRNTLFFVLLTGCSLGQALFMLGDRAEQPGHIIYLAAALAALYLLLLCLNIAYLVPHFLLKNRYIEYLTLLLAGTVAVLLCIKYIAGYPILCPFGITRPFAITLLDAVSNLAITTICITSCLMPTLVKQWMIDTKAISNLENRRLRSTIDEFKNHINPELLYGTIRHISHEVKTAPHKASDMIIVLSELLRYEIYDCKREKVILKSDIEFIRNYLSLQQQMSTVFTYSISVTGNTNLFVPPFGFISFVQEILKRQPENLSLHYKIDETVIELSCEISVDSSRQTKSMIVELKEC